MDEFQKESTKATEAEVDQFLHGAHNDPWLALFKLKHLEARTHGEDETALRVSTSALYLAGPSTLVPG